MKKVYKWGIWVLLTPVFMFVILTILLYVPTIQNWAVDKIASYASEETGLDISVDHVKLVFPLDLGVDGVMVLRQNDTTSLHKDTIANIHSLAVDVRFWPLLKKQIEIDGLDLWKVRINTADLIASASVKGIVERMRLESHGVDLGKEFIRINNASIIDGRINVSLSDTVPEDTSKTKNHWKIHVDKLAIIRTGVTVHMPGDTLRVGAYLGDTNLESGEFDLYNEIYHVKKIDLGGGKLNYDNNLKVHSKGFDVNHVALSDISLGIDSFSYHNSKLHVLMCKGAFKEKCGIHVMEFVSRVSMDSTRFNMPKLQIRTPESSFYANVAMGSGACGDTSGMMNIVVDASLGKQDIMRLVPNIPLEFMRKWPNYPLTAKGIVNGNVKSARISGFVLELPTAFSISSNGTVGNVTDVENFSADIGIKARTYEIGFLTSLIGTAQAKIPNGITMIGNLKAVGKKYKLNMDASEAGGHLVAVANADMSTMSYQARLEADALALQHFIPNNGFGRFSGVISVSGVGVDVLSKHTKLTAKASISEFRYAGYDLSGIQLSADVNRGIGRVSLNSRNSLIDGSMVLDAIMNTSKIQAIVSCNLAKVDLYNLRVLEKPGTASLRADFDVCSNLKSDHKLQGSIRDIFFTDSIRTYHPENIVMDMYTGKDSTHVVLSSGDFNMRFDAHGGYELLIQKGNDLMAEAKKQLNERYIDQVRIREHLPYMTFHFEAGKENFFCRTLNRFGYHFGMAHVDMSSSTLNGINGKIDVDSLVIAGIQLDTIRIALNSDSVRTDFNGQVRNGPKNPQYAFNALFGGAFYERGLYFGTRVLDAQNRVGISLGLNAAMEENGLRLRLGGKETPILGYKHFHVNKDNYLFLSDDRRVSANLKLHSDDGMGVNVYTNDSTEALQDLTVGLTKFELSKVLSVIPYLPNISGVMNGDFHVIQTADEMSVSSAVTIDDLVYEKSPMGDISSEFVYMPKGDGSHFIDGTLSCNDMEVGYISGTYDSAGDGLLDAELTLDRTPLMLMNGFIPDHIFSFAGYASGALSVKGSLSEPIVDGELQFDSAYIASAPYGVELQFAKNPVKISKSHLLFEDFNMYAHNKSPLSLTGYYDFSNFDNMYLDLGVRATNYLLIDSKENPRSEVYGKAYVNFYAKLKGSLESLNVRGKLDVLGSTDMTYILRDSPLTTDNRMDELVKFVNFNDDTEIHTVTRPPLTGINMDFSMSIDEGAHIVCALNANHTNYVDLIGGGNLRMQYNVVDGFRLTGRYTLSNGEMKYSLPVIPLKTFTIQDGSYIEFSGDPMNPKLNITATEHTKSTVSTDGGNGRSVEFDCGVVITKTLQDMGLQFIIDAPEDMTIHNELQTMSEENRGKLAVTMLTTGMYLSGGNTNSFSMNNALSAFLNSQINSISGNALRTLDLSFGMDNTTLGTGETQTDYSFKFAKRFWNNRLNIVVGGKVSTGADVENQNNTFFDNVTFEYRLSQNSNKYLKLFYERDSYDWLEGNVGKYGGGFMWRRKLQHFRDIFRFKSAKRRMPQLKNDTVIVKK